LLSMSGVDRDAQFTATKGKCYQSPLLQAIV